MTFAAALVAHVKDELKTAQVAFDDAGDADYFAALHFELLLRRPAPRPRRVRFSQEIRASLGQLKADSVDQWRTVFHLRDLLVQGKDVTSFLSTRVGTPLSDLPKTDGLLLDFGMHHFHLCRALKTHGPFRVRTASLLFALIGDADAYFVDIRPHSPPN